jgi:DedD protein
VSDFSDFPANDADGTEIKKRARRRLVGASVLAVLAVIILPLALDNSEAPRAVPDMQVSIPGRGEAELPPLPPEGGSESGSGVIEPDAAPAAPEIPLEIPPSLPAQSSPPRSVQPVPEPPATRPAREARPENAPPQAARPAKDDEAARVQALLNDTAPKASPKAKDQVFVQIGAYNNAARANKHAKELKKKGFAAYAEKAGKVVRVRIGPLSRDEGEKAVARLKAQGRKAVLVSR